MFLACNFLFTSSDTFAVGSMIKPQNAQKEQIGESLKYLLQA